MVKQLCFGVFSVLTALLCACQMPTSSFDPPKCEHDLTVGEKYYGTWLSQEKPDSKEQRKFVIQKYVLSPEILKLLEKNKTPEEQKKGISSFEKEFFSVSVRLQTLRKKTEDPILEQTDTLPLGGFFFRADNKLFLCAGWDYFSFLLGKYDFTTSAHLFKPMFYTFLVTDLPEGAMKLDFVTFIESVKDPKSPNGAETKKKTSPSLELYQDQVVLNPGEVIFKAIETGEYKLLPFGTFVREAAPKK